MSLKSLWVIGRNNELPRWHPEQHLAEASARRGLTVDAYRARIRDLVTEARTHGPHLSLQVAQSRDFSDAEAAHVQTCGLCARLIETIQATDADIRRFDDALRQRTARTAEEPPVSPVPLVVRHRRPAYSVPAVCGVFVVAIAAGALTYLAMPLTRLESRSPSAVAAKEPTALAAPYAYSTEQLVISTPELFKSAAYSEQSGQPELAQALVVAGFTSSDLNDAQRKVVTDTLQTMAAQWESERHLAARGANELRVSMQVDDSQRSAQRLVKVSQLSFEAGEREQGYQYLLAYLEATGPNEETTASFKRNFVDVAIAKATDAATTGSK